MRSGDVIWCNTCGSFGALRGRGLAQSCPGPVPLSMEGGRAQQLRRLRAGFHPKDRYRLPAAVPQAMWSADDTRTWSGIARLQPRPEHTPAPNNDTGQTHEAPARSRSSRRTRAGRAVDDADAEDLLETPFGRLRLRTRQRERNAEHGDNQRNTHTPPPHTPHEQTNSNTAKRHAHDTAVQRLIEAATSSVTHTGQANQTTRNKRHTTERYSSEHKRPRYH